MPDKVKIIYLSLFFPLPFESLPSEAAIGHSWSFDPKHETAVLRRQEKEWRWFDPRRVENITSNARRVLQEGRVRACVSVSWLMGIVRVRMQSRLALEMTSAYVADNVSLSQDLKHNNPPSWFCSRKYIWIYSDSIKSWGLGTPYFIQFY